MSNTDSTTASTTDPSTFAEGSWQETLANSEKKRVTSERSSKAATKLLWEGAQSAINDWLPNHENDVDAEGLAAEAQAALGGKHRKGDASKIKTVANAVKNNGLRLESHSNLSNAYKEAVRLTKTVKSEAAEDEAAEKAIAELDAPKSASSPEGAAKVVLAHGVDEAVKLLCDALGEKNFEAHKSLMRAMSSEISARVQAAKPKPAPKASGPKAGATKPKATPKKKASVAKPKAKPEAKSEGKTAKPKAQVATKAKPKPVKRAAKPKAQSEASALFGESDDL